MITIRNQKGEIICQRHEFLDTDRMQETLVSLYNDVLDSFGIDRGKYEEYVEDFSFENAVSFEESMFEYCHRRDTSMVGNFADIRQDWNDTKDFVESDIEPWGDFDEIVKSIDEKTISEDDLTKFQTWAHDWFFKAFGTYNIKYNFGDFISEEEYCREMEREGLKTA